MKSLVSLWVLLLTAFTALISLPGTASAAEIPALELSAGEDGPELAPYVRFKRQPASRPTPPLPQILRQQLDTIQGATIHFGPPGDKTLVLLKIRNGGNSQGSWILTTGRGSLKYFRLYESRGEQLDLLVDATNPEIAGQNLGTYQAFSTEVVLDPAQEKLLLIEFVSENSTYMPLKLQTYGTFFTERRANIAMVSGVVVGALTLLLLNFLFFSMTGHREFLWLAVAEAFFALNTIHSEGYITIFFLYDQPLAGVALEDFIKCGFAGAMAQFARSFVQTARFFPKRDIALKGLIISALAVMILQAGLIYYPAGLRFSLHVAGWTVTVGVALFLPFVGYAAMRRLGYQLWPLFVGWASLAVFIVYSAIASMGVFTWLPVNWHLAGPVGLFESIMVTLALGLHVKKIRNDKLVADANYARSLQDQLAISEQSKRLAEEKAQALETVNSQNALLHASGHDSRQVILALNSAVEVLKRGDRAEADGELVDMLQSSADYLNEIVSTTISGANIAATDTHFVALSSFPAQALLEPLSMMFKTLFARKNLSLDIRTDDPVTMISDKPLLMRALANLLGNSYKYTDSGGVDIRLSMRDDTAQIVVRDSGTGMSAALVAALNNGGTTRLRGDESMQGTGSGFGATRRIIETLGGSLKVIASSKAGTEVQILLPAAFSDVTPIATEALQARLPDWTVLDFDQRQAFDDGLNQSDAKDRPIIALTYDDTTVTRGRLSQLVTMIVIKPACDELLRHPLLVGTLEQV